MKKSILLFVLFSISISFYGCPYDSKVAIDEPSIKVDKSYSGMWVTKGGGTQYLVTKLDDYHLKIAQLPYVSKEANATDSKDTTFYNVHFSKIKDVSFLNVSQKTKYDAPGSENYYLYKFSVKSENEISLTEITSNIKEKFSSSEKLKKYIEKYMDLSFFFGAESIYVREL
ncbi:MAG: hypothetical protein WC358_03855 [Ignavibacteria bacterium]|jgi:hypothetical protein